jgi:hypothetical protein
MGKNKKKNKFTQVQNMPKQLDVSTPEKMEEAVSNIATATNETDFESRKKSLIDALQKQIEEEIAKAQKEKNDIENEKKAAESARDAAEAAKKNVENEIERLKGEKTNLEAEKARLSSDKSDIQSEYDEAVKTIDSAQSEAEEIKNNAKADAEITRNTAVKEAEQIKDGANKERLKIVADARLEAMNAWKAECDRLKDEFNKLGNERTELEKERREFNRKKEEWKIDSEAFDEEKNYVGTLRKKYQECQPEKLQILEDQIKANVTSYNALKDQYDALKRMFAQNQAFIDSLQISLKDTSGKEISLKEIAPEINEMLSRYRELQEVYNRYPNIQAIEALEQKANRSEALEIEKTNLLQDIDTYKEKAAASVRTSRELETIRREVEATNALNQHLIQELESHKTALENRTGDVCPDLRKVDEESNKPEYQEKINKIFRKKELQDLKSLVSHIKNYAGCIGGKKERLFYKDDDVRAFISGMAVSRLIILQGMSGTGKSSLPRAVAESISSFNKLIPVESSWRDRNELLGYYNDFNKKFNAKSFTIELYRSGKKICANIPTFMVLDEMNLARIEYYFSDFLAILQQPNPEDWVVDLVASDMRTLPMHLSKEAEDDLRKQDADAYGIWQNIQKSRTGDLTISVSDDAKQKLCAVLEKMQCLVGAQDLIDGRKIRVPENVWFVGTANKDESTFEISDKVYDRAQVIVLNDRGEPEEQYPPTEKGFISVENLLNLFENAKSRLDKKTAKEVEDRLKELEDFLKEHFSIAFGNRIYNQAKDFAAVFIDAGGKLEDALDYQISTKIWRKIESCDNNPDDFIELSKNVTNYRDTYKLVTKKIKEITG